MQCHWHCQFYLPRVSHVGGRIDPIKLIVLTPISIKTIGPAQLNPTAGFFQQWTKAQPITRLSDVPCEDNKQPLPLPGNMLARLEKDFY